MEKLTYTGEGYKTVLMAGEWRIAFLRFAERFSRLCQWERHFETHECFILLSGSGTMYTRDDADNVTATPMELNTVYDVLPGEWHHIIVSEDATVLIAENADTGPANSEKVLLEGGCSVC